MAHVRRCCSRIGKPTKGEHSLTSLQRWALDVERRTHHNKATIALANKMARIIWVTWTRAQDYAAR